jgi:hypothetical protein
MEEMSMSEKKERTPTIHKKDMVLNKDKLKEILDRRGMEYIELHDKLAGVNSKYGLDITYKGFMSLLSNRSTWKLLYAHAISDILLINYMEIFEIVDVDVEKEKVKKKKWKEKYQK